MNWKWSWQSATLWFNSLGLGFFYLSPEVKAFVCQNTNLAAGILAMNIVFRLKTKSAIKFKAPKAFIVVLMASILTSCAGVDQKLDPNVFYKRDTTLEVNGESFEGVTTVPYASSYSIVIKPRGGIDLMLIRSCHREESYEKISAGWFGKNQFRYSYFPIRGIEDTRVCPLRVDIYDSSKSKHSWAFLDFTSPEYRVQATMSCNGKISSLNGVGVCQAKWGLVQRLKFADRVRFAPPKPAGCSVPVKTDNGYEIALTLGECLYQFDTEDGRMGRLTTIGYDGVLVRETQ